MRTPKWSKDFTVTILSNLSKVEERTRDLCNEVKLLRDTVTENEKEFSARFSELEQQLSNHLVQHKAELDFANRLQKKFEFRIKIIGGFCSILVSILTVLTLIGWLKQ